MGNEASQQGSGRLKAVMTRDEILNGLKTGRTLHMDGAATAEERALLHSLINEGLVNTTFVEGDQYNYYKVTSRPTRINSLEILAFHRKTHENPGNLIRVGREGDLQQASKLTEEKSMNYDNQKALCTLCGEPMPEGEQMFNYHGYSGSCPKPPIREKAEWRAERIDHDDGKISYEVHSTTEGCEPEEESFIKFEGVNAKRDMATFMRGLSVAATK
jgi:hypothetical protein